MTRARVLNLFYLFKKKFQPFFSDDRPCKTDIPIQYKRAALIINFICIIISLILILLLWYHSTQKILKTSSPRMLFMVLLGAIVSYSEILPMYFEPGYWTCMSAQVFYLEGFLLAYGALVLKTWRFFFKF